MFKLKTGINFESKAFLEAEKMASFLPEKIKEIHSFESGRNFSNRSIAYDYGLVVRFENKDDLATYINHEYHQKVVQAWKEIAEWIIVDF